MTAAETVVASQPRIKSPKGLSPRIQWLRDYYFQGTGRAWNNEFTAWTTGTPWDVQYDEGQYYIVPENYYFFDTFRASYHQTARPVALPEGFWHHSLAERRAIFLKEVLLRYLPREILPGDLLAGGRFNIQTSLCLTRKESRQRDRAMLGRKGVRARVKNFHTHGYGNAGATPGHLIPNYQKVLHMGWKGIYEEIDRYYQALPAAQQKGEKGAQLRAMMTAATIPQELARAYAAQCDLLAGRESEEARREELTQMGANLREGVRNPPRTFWQAVQVLWLSHMLVMSDENYPGPGVSFGRIDQYLLPFWQKSIDAGMTPEFGKEILKCFWIHANTAYDAMIRTGGNQGITSGFGQLITLSGLGPAGEDRTNALTYAVLEVIDEMSPILEPKPNIRLHRHSPEALLEKIAGMIAESQGAPFLLNFDERSLAGMMRQARKAGLTDLIHADNVFDYAPVGCLENTMTGNDRSGTVDCNLNLFKAVEMALTGGRDMLPYADPAFGKPEKIRQDGPATGDARKFISWEQFWQAYARQTEHIVNRCVDLYEAAETVRARYAPTPYLSCLVEGCAAKARDITRGGAEINFVTLEAVTFGTTVDSLLAVKYLVFDEKHCSMDDLLQALRANWQGFERLQAKARFKAPKYGRDDDTADAMAAAVMKLWCDETWKHQTRTTGRQFRPGMLSWNYWVGDSFILPASPDGRPRGQFLSNAICPSNGADTRGPTANANSVGKALGGRAASGDAGDWQDYVNRLPNGASHTMTFNPSLLKDTAHRQKFIAFLRGYAENGGTALQINMLDPAMLKEAQQHPRDYRHLLVRITGYNAYFTNIGRELQNEVIARLDHSRTG